MTNECLAKNRECFTDFAQRDHGRFMYELSKGLTTVPLGNGQRKIYRSGPLETMRSKMNFLENYKLAFQQMHEHLLSLKGGIAIVSVLYDQDGGSDGELVCTYEFIPDGN